MATQFGLSAEYRASVKAPTLVHFELNYDAASGTFTIPVKAGTFVHKVVTVVKTAFNATSPALTVGDGDDADGYLTSVNVALATAGTGTAPAVKDSSGIANPYQFGKYYAADDTIDFAWTQGTSGTAGVLKGYVVMSNVKNDGLSA